jgi:hypothetical protein
MPVIAAYCKNVFSTLLPCVIQGLAFKMRYSRSHLTHFSFVFNDVYNNIPAGNTAAGNVLFFKGLA